MMAPLLLATTGLTAATPRMRSPRVKEKLAPASTY